MMCQDETYYKVLAKERGAKLKRIETLIELGRSLQAEPGVILDNILAIIQEPLEDTNFFSRGVE